MQKGVPEYRRTLSRIFSNTAYAAKKSHLTHNKPARVALVPRTGQGSVLSYGASTTYGYLMACFDEQVNESTIKEIAKQQPYYFVLRDASLATDQVADNFEQIWEEYSKDTVRRII